jgi:hypothetical protein
VTLALAACSATPPAQPAGKIVVAMTIDWEGDDLSKDNLDAVDDLRKTLGAVPLTHFVSAAYATKQHPVTAVTANIARLVRPGDELAVHLHAWQSLAAASGVTPKISPSFLTGTDDVLQLGDGDVGFDTDLDAYDVPALRAMLVESRHVLEKVGPVSRSFRAGGYLATPKMLLALGDEGYSVDSSAIDPRRLHDLDDDQWQQRLTQVWPRIDATTQPFYLRAGPVQLLELPIAVVVDYASTAELVSTFEVAHAHLVQDPAHDVFVVVAFHLETLSDFAGRLVDAITQLRANPKIAGELMYATVDEAAELARFTLQ